MVEASIIITTYNRPDLLLKRSLRSAFKQVFKDYEIIVVDDASTEKYPEISGIKYIKHERNKGLAAARNTGIRAAQGRYISCLDDDNELLPNFLTETINGFGHNPFIDAVGVGRIIQGKEIADYVVPKISKWTSIDWGWLIKKEVFNHIQYDEQCHANEDADFGIRFFKQFNARIIDKVLCIAYDCDDPKQSLSYPTERELAGMEYFFNKNYLEYNDTRELWHLYRLMGRKFYRGGHRKRGINYFWQGFKIYPTFRTFLNFVFILFGWFIYDKYMTVEERIGSKLRK